MSNNNTSPSSPSPPPAPAIFDEAQLAKYFDHIKLPEKYRSDSVPRDLALLTALHRHQIAAIPYENLSLHYSPTKTIALDPRVLYDKFVTKGARHRGGYCMEGSLFFLNVLRSLGFRAYPSAVRIRLREDGVPAGDYIAFTHLVLIIELLSAPDGGEGGSSSITRKYVCDPAFGGDGPTVPLPLEHGVVTRNLGTQELRLAYERVPRSVHEFWVYQYRNGPDRPWNSFYAFHDTECLEADFQSINYFTSQAPTFQKTTVIIVKFLLAPDGDGEEKVVVGKLMLVNGVVKRNMGGKTEVVQVCSTEPERIEALRKWFGMEFTEEEIAGIKGTVTELKPAEVITA